MLNYSLIQQIQIETIKRFELYKAPAPALIIKALSPTKFIPERQAVGKDINKILSKSNYTGRRKIESVARLSLVGIL